MNEALFDISILGGGISCLASLKYLISLKSNLKISLFVVIKISIIKKYLRNIIKAFHLVI